MKLKEEPDKNFKDLKKRINLRIQLEIKECL